jgi:CheY-like chemotaxis protein
MADGDCGTFGLPTRLSRFQGTVTPVHSKQIWHNYPKGTFKVVEPMSTSLGNTTVLVVDDNPDTCDLLRTVLQQLGATVAVTGSVQDAVRAFRHCPAHAVITDIRLRDSDGYELLEAIRQCNAEYKGYTPVIALTAYASPEDEERAMAAGFYAYLRKPFDPQDVVVAVIRGLRSSLDFAA